MGPKRGRCVSASFNFSLRVWAVGFGLQRVHFLFPHSLAHTTLLPPSTRIQVAARKSAPTRSRRTTVVVNAGMTVKSLKPTGNRVLVLPDEKETKSAGGILLSTSDTSSGPGSSICGMANPLQYTMDRAAGSIYGERMLANTALPLNPTQPAWRQKNTKWRKSSGIVHLSPSHLRGRAFTHTSRRPATGSSPRAQSLSSRHAQACVDCECRLVLR
jgi:hypothetical protein